MNAYFFIFKKLMVQIPLQNNKGEPCEKEIGTIISQYKDVIFNIRTIQ